MKKCVYCNVKISEECPVDICESCGLKVWGENMFKAILKNTQNARENGDIS